MHIFFTGAEAKKSKVPFLLDASMQPITAANAWLQGLAQDGATSSPCSWKTYGVPSARRLDNVLGVSIHRAEGTRLSGQKAQNFQPSRDLLAGHVSEARRDHRS